MQKHDHLFNILNNTSAQQNIMIMANSAGYSNFYTFASGTGDIATMITFKDVMSGRSGTTTHGKQKGIKYIIKVL